MKQRRSADEMASYLQQLREFVGGSAFAAERRLACREFLGAIGRGAAAAVEAAAVEAAAVDTAAVGGSEVGGSEAGAAEAQPVAEAATGRHGEEALERRIAYSDWFLFHRCHSGSDRTPVRMFVEEHPALPEHIRANLLACEQSVGSVFSVVAPAGEAVIVLDLGGEHSDYYRVCLSAEQHWVRPGEMLRGRLVRWDEEYWFHGPVERWPATARDLLGEPEGYEPGVDSLRRGALRRGGEGGLAFGTRAGWLRDRRTRP